MSILHKLYDIAGRLALVLSIACYAVIGITALQTVLIAFSIGSLEQAFRTVNPRLSVFAAEQQNFSPRTATLSQDTQELLPIFGLESELETQAEQQRPVDSEVEPEDLTNILLAGKHWKLTDTIILASINHVRDEVTLVSFPRDLQWGGRKINSYNAYYGMDGLVQQIERIAGVKIHHWVLVDMYAFIDIVDTIGGVEICLDKPLTDYTYKTEDNGVKGYLNVEAGCHTFNGTQALRLARSRYSSSDFARSERQQQIIAALKAKILSMQLHDIGKIASIASTLLSKVETDTELPGNAFRLYTKCKNYTLKGNNVLSTSNVLQSTMYKKDPENEEEKGVYILQPRGGSWWRIKNYVWEKINTPAS